MRRAVCLELTPASVMGSYSLSVFKSRLKHSDFVIPINLHTQPTAASASEVTILWRFTNMLMLIIIIISSVLCITLQYAN